MLRDVIRNLTKDIRVELRERSAVAIALAFAAVSTIAAGIVTGGAALGALERSIILWLILFFSAMSGLSHIFVREEERETALLLRLTSTPGAVFTAKLIFNLLFFLALLLCVTPLFVFFIEGDIASPGAFAGVILAGGTALASAATVLSSMAAKAGGRASLFTVISFPVMLPVLMTAVASTAACMDRSAYAALGDIGFLLAFSGAVIAVSYLIFEYIWTGE